MNLALLTTLILGCQPSTDGPGSSTNGGGGGGGTAICDASPVEVGACATLVDCDGDGVCESDLSGPDGCGICGVTCGGDETCRDGHVCVSEAGTYPRFTDLAGTGSTVCGKIGSTEWICGLWPTTFESYWEGLGVAQIANDGFTLLEDGTVAVEFEYDAECRDERIPALIDGPDGSPLGSVVEIAGNFLSDLVGQGCARTSDGSVYCFEGDAKGTLHDRGIARATAISGAAAGCAAIADGSVVCWDDTVDNYTIPCLDGVVDIDGGGFSHMSTCAARADGTVACFGEAWEYGGYQWYDAFVIGGISDAVEVETAYHHVFDALHSCSRSAHGKVWCWDSDNAAQELPLLEGAVQIEMGAITEYTMPSGVRPLSEVCALFADGRRTCQLWDSETLYTEEQVPDWCSEHPGGCASWAGLTGEGSGKAACGWTVAGTMVCWGDDDPRLGTGGVLVENEAARDGLVALDLPDAVVDAGMGGDHTCALLANGDVYCWGTATLGVLGTGVDDGSVATPALAFQGATELAVGDSGVCVTDGMGSVWCWGENASGEISGDPAMTGVIPTPTLVGDLDAAQVEDAGWGQFCALTNASTVTCWGQPAGLPATAPTDQGLVGITTVAGFDGVICAANAALDWWCWGGSQDGAIGGTAIWEDFPAPTPVPELTSSDKVWPGAAICYRSQAGSVRCRGEDTWLFPSGVDGEEPRADGALDIVVGRNPQLVFADTRPPMTWNTTCSPWSAPFRY